MKVLIVGGVAGGATAATRIRRMDEDAEIIIFERSSYVSYANCGLPYYVGDEITEKNALTLLTPNGFLSRYKVKVKVRHEVIDINPSKKTVLVKDLNSNDIYEESYDKLLLSPGAKPITLSFLDKPVKNVFTIRTVEDTFKIKEYLNYKDVKKAAIIGGGFVGVEMAENLTNLGIDVTIIQKDSQLLNIFDKDIISFIHNYIREKNVELLFNREVVDVFNEERNVIVKMIDDVRSFDVVILAIGVTPDNILAKKAGLTLEDSGAISVNSRMQTSIKDIYAVGDAVAIRHNVLDEKRMISLAGPANKEARIAADNICGIDSEYQGSIASSVIKIFDLTAATVGINEREAKKAGFNYEKVILSPLSHASYYPNATIMTLKVLYDRDTLNILGAQAIGFSGVDKRIDVIATAIFAKMKANMLKDLDLVYAPPYSSAKDPVNMAGCIIDNIISGKVKQFYYEDLVDLRLQKDVILLDTRTAFEYSNGFAVGFINIPLDELRDKINLLDKNKKIYVMCHSGLRSYLAVRILMQNGFDAYNFAGGFRLYRSIKNEENGH